MFANLNFAGRKALAYLRKSTNDTNRQKYSIQSQREQIAAWCQQHGVALFKTFKDDHSAKTFNRPGWNELVAYLATHKHDQKADLLLVIDYSRFSRDEILGYVSINQLEQYGVELQAIDQLLDYSIPESKIMRGNYMTMPAVDNAWRSIKVKRGMTLSLRAGNWCGGVVPKGYWRDKNEGMIIPNQEGQILAYAMQNIIHGMPVGKALDEIRMRGIHLSFQSFSKLLRNPFYCGKISHKLLDGDVVEGKHEGVITIDEWNELQDVLSGNNKGLHKNLEIFPLKGFMKCPNCGCNYTGYQVKKKQKPNGEYRLKKSQPIYYKCKCANVSGKNVHIQFEGILDGLSLNPKYYEAFREMAIQMVEKMEGAQKQARTTISQQIGKIEAQLERLEERYLYDGDIDRGTFEKHTQKLQQKLSELHELQQPEVDLSNPTDFADFALQSVSNMGVRWSESDISLKRGMQRWMFPEGILYDKPNGQYLTPRMNVIFNITRSLSVALNEKTDSKKPVIQLWQSVPTQSLTPLTDNHTTFIEDILALEKSFELLKKSKI